MKKGRERETRPDCSNVNSAFSSVGVALAIRAPRNWDGTLNESADSDRAIMPGRRRDLKDLIRSDSARESCGRKVFEASAEGTSEEGVSEEGMEEEGAEEEEEEL